MMTIDFLEKMHKNSVALLIEANRNILDDEKHFWYGGGFYSGSLNPKVLFVGFNPGYEREEWKTRPSNLLSLQKNGFPSTEVKYIEERNLRLGKRIFEIFNHNEQYIKENVAETNFIHFNSPDIKTYYESLSCIPQEVSKKLSTHFYECFEKIIQEAKPKLIVIIGMTTFDDLLQMVNFEEIKTLATNTKGNRTCLRAKIKTLNTDVIVTKHLSMAISNENMEQIKEEINKLLR